MQRIQKIIAQTGITSRRKAEVLISRNQVLVNGQVVKLGDKASTNDIITINGKVLPPRAHYVYYLLNKPIKTITSLKDPQGRQTVCDLVATKVKVFPVGRLDYNTTGTLLLTNDGDLAYKLTHPSFEIIRVYRARLTMPLHKKELDFLNGNAVKLNNQKAKQKVTQVAPKSYVIALHQGSYHHIKKLFALVNKKVIALTRIEFAGITSKGLPRGQSRELKPHEVKWLKALVAPKTK